MTDSLNVLTMAPGSPVPNELTNIESGIDQEIKKNESGDDRASVPFGGFVILSKFWQRANQKL